MHTFIPNIQLQHELTVLLDVYFIDLEFICK